MTMKYQLVLQWPAHSIEDYDSLIELEDFLIENLSSNSVVDGHDAGSGECNIFLLTDNPEFVFVELKTFLFERGVMTDARIAYRDLKSDEFTILWPMELREFKVL